MTIDQSMQIALEHHRAGRLHEAETLYRQVLSQEPGQYDALHLLGVLAGQAGKPDLGIQLINRALLFKPDLAGVHHDLGFLLSEAGRLDEAIGAYTRAVQVDPEDVESHFNLGNCLMSRGRLDEAISSFRRTIEIKPDYAEAHSNLGVALNRKKEYDESVAACGRAIELKPEFAEARANLALALHNLGRIDDAIEACRKAVEIDPGYINAQCVLANLWKEQGRLDQTIAQLRSAVAIDPHHAIAHSNLLYCIQFHPDFDATAIHREHKIWNERQAEPLRRFIQPHANSRDPNRRLRIGYVSPEFRDHCQSFFTIPLFSNHNREQFEVFCYSTRPSNDATTARLQSHVRDWRDVSGASEEQIADLIRRDGIDILVDLVLHMAYNRLLIFARKPAPVQVTWLGYPGSTGLTTIDYRISDPYLDPPGTSDTIYSEKTVFLPETFWCYDPLFNEPWPNDLPAISSDHVTFGSLNNFCKVNNGVMELWAGVLLAVPNSRMLILTPAGSHRQEIIDSLARRSVDPGRIELIEPRLRPEYLQLYHRIDIALDTVPYNGHTTSLDAMWMGVPTVTLVGKTVVGRAGISQLSNVGLTELIAHSPEEYVRIASEWASDLPRLQALRSTLRDRLQASPLMDGPRFARNMEQAYRTMWQKWCL